MTEAQIHIPFDSPLSNKQNYISFSDNSFSQNSNLFSKTQNVNFRSHDDREIVMANDKTFGALDFQHDDINLDADNKLSQLLLRLSQTNLRLNFHLTHATQP
jgi:hypothetical protein